MDERHEVDVVKIKCLCSMCGVTRMDSWRTEVVRRKVGVSEKMSDRVDRKVLKCFRHVERMSGKLLTRRGRV